MAQKSGQKKVVVIGGGTGTYTVLLGLKKYAIELSVIVTMMDSGGSNRVLRDEFGLLPTSDIRQCMVALSSEDADRTLRKLFTYRYNAGTGIAGMTFGNLFMAALTDIYKGNQEKAINETCELLGVKGSIIPVTFDNTNLVARYSNGKQVLGEHAIEEPNGDFAKHKIVEVEVFPDASANKKAVDAVIQADLIIIGPGDLYTSVIPNLLITGMTRALKKTHAKKVYVMNLMTRHGQTDGYTASKHLSELEKYLETKVDCVLVNKSDTFPKRILKRYEEELAYPVADDMIGVEMPRVIRGNFISKEIYEKPKSDKLTRSLIRHDSDKLAKAIVNLL